MKRTVVGVAMIAGMVQLTATPAQAAPKIDPVKVLKAELAPGKAVNVQATAKVTYGRGMSAASALEGTIGFGTRGPIAADLAQTVQYSENLLRGLMKTFPEETEALQEGPTRMISSGHVSYVSGPVVDDALPKDTSWVRYRDADMPASNLLLEILEPATLKTLLAHRTSSRDGVVKGSIKATKLAAVSTSFASRIGMRSKSGRDGKISYTLWLGPNGLVERLSAKAVLPFSKSSIQIESETRYSDWGRQVTVLLPLEGDVIDQTEVEDDVPADVPGIWN
ncbi:hypothetical protein [Nonomuraea basaltis]|uniref:hypothetical protein n=1 Tax=Nonomuraea basaltis TaxID=2495887 RepID=UPI00110C5E22|nr:hypothetical protein [Nonomuraea basaltis]TMS00717.1 hypothetical protein EJK15_00210 [Nonomuraea basaltis]